jgi:hypothetical protein
MANYHFYVNPGSSSKSPHVWGIGHDLNRGYLNDFFTFFTIDTSWQDTYKNHRIHIVSSRPDETFDELWSTRDKLLNTGWERLFDFSDDWKMNHHDYSNRLVPAMIGSLIQIYCEHALVSKPFNLYHTMNLISSDVKRSFLSDASSSYVAITAFLKEHEKLNASLIDFSKKHYQRNDDHLYQLSATHAPVPKGKICPIW